MANVKTKRGIAVFCAAALLGLAGCATEPGSQKRDAGEFASDAALTAKVKTAIAKDVGAGAAANINVNSFRGEVQLSGFVASADQAQRAASAARAVDGVAAVRNDVRVK
jgi:osmotically-inducible protein OsmY